MSGGDDEQRVRRGETEGEKGTRGGAIGRGERERGGGKLEVKYTELVKNLL